MPDKPASVEAYIEACPERAQPVLRAVRERMLAAAPGVTEAVSYGIASWVLPPHRTRLYAAGWKAHVAIYPVPPVDAGLATELEAFRTAKGTLRFPLRDPFPFEVLDRVLAAVTSP